MPRRLKRLSRKPKPWLSAWWLTASNMGKRVRSCGTSPSRLHERGASTKARRVLTALYKLGWQLKRQTGSHRTLSREGWPDVVFAFHDREEIGPRMLARIAKRTGLRPEDL